MNFSLTMSGSFNYFEYIDFKNQCMINITTDIEIKLKELYYIFNRPKSVRYYYVKIIAEKHPWFVTINDFAYYLSL